jgi:hypothetical protein
MALTSPVQLRLPAVSLLLNDNVVVLTILNSRLMDTLALGLDCRTLDGYGTIGVAPDAELVL